MLLLTCTAMTFFDGEEKKAPEAPAEGGENKPAEGGDKPAEGGEKAAA